MGRSAKQDGTGKNDQTGGAGRTQSHAAPAGGRGSIRRGGGAGARRKKGHGALPRHGAAAGRQRPGGLWHHHRLWRFCQCGRSGGDEQPAVHQSDPQSLHRHRPALFRRAGPGHDAAAGQRPVRGAQRRAARSGGAAAPDAQRRRYPCGAPEGLAGRLRRSGPPEPHRAGAAGPGRGLLSGPPSAGAAGHGAGGPSLAGDAGEQGGPWHHQRHLRHDQRGRAASLRRPPRRRPGGSHRVHDLYRPGRTAGRLSGAAAHRPGPAGPDPGGGKSAAAHRRLRDAGKKPGAAGAGRLCPPLHPSGPRRRAGRAGVYPQPGGHRAERRHRQSPALLRGRRGDLRRQLPRGAHGPAL